MRLNYPAGFKRLIAGYALSTAGDAGVRMLLAWITLERLGTSAMSGVFIGSAAACLFGPLVGRGLDRGTPRLILGLSCLGRAALLAALCLLDPMTTARWAPAVSFLTTLLSLSYAPAVAKALPLMFSGEKLNEANALNGAAFLIASAIGPALGGAVLARSGLRAGCAAFALLSLANAPLAFAHLLPRPSAVAGAPRPSRRLLELMRALAASPAVLALALMGVLLNFCLAPINVALAPMMLSFGAGPDGYGFAMSVFVAGALAGNVLVGSRLTRGVAWDRSIFASLGAMALGLASVGLSGSAAQATASMALLGALVPFFQVPMSTYLQRAIPPEDAGQAFASLNAVTTASAPLAAAGAGLLLRTVSPAALFHCAGGACALLCLGWAVSRRQEASVRVYDAA